MKIMYYEMKWNNLDLQRHLTTCVIMTNMCVVFEENVMMAIHIIYSLTACLQVWY
jgi:hypothetical protein